MKIGIVGYGNLGKGIAKRASVSDEFEIVGIFSRRKISSDFAPVYKIEKVYSFKKKIDCLLLAGGSSSDLPLFSPLFAKDFNIVDSFDNHEKVREHFESVNLSAQKGERVAIISAGWDPGIFSAFRILGKSILIDAKLSSFWGKGISQGHSEAIKRIDGVKNAVQYTIPKEEAISEALLGNIRESKKSHVRICYVVAEPLREREIEEKIKSIPGYFKGYETNVNFISDKEFREQHNSLYHGGRVISFGKTGLENQDVATMEISLKMNANPDFTAGIMLAYARAVKRFFDIRDYGAKTPLQVPLEYIYKGDFFEFI